ncbi:sialidase family protein [[Eubacterium] cellulosolvens]
MVKIISKTRNSWLSKIILAMLVFSIGAITFCEAISESPIEINESNTTVTIPPFLENRTDQLSGPLSGLFMIEKLKSQNISPQFFDSSKEDNGIIRVREVIPPWTPEILLPPKPLLSHPQSEPSITANPNSPNKLVAIYHDIKVDSSGNPITPFFVISASYTSDGGKTWNGPAYLPIANNWDFAFDPVVRWSSNGKVYASYISLDISTGNTALTVTISNDGGMSWSEPIMPHQATAANNELVDKEWIAVRGNNIALSFTTFQTGTIRIQTVISKDGGSSWTSPVTIASSTTNVLQGSSIVWGNNPGEIYIAWYDDNGSLRTGDASIYFSKSTDYGLSWSIPKLAAPIPNEIPRSFNPAKIAPITCPIPDLGIGDLIAWPTMFPHLAVGPEGIVYLVSTTDPSGSDLPAWPSDQGDIIFTRSQDQGITWKPIKIFNLPNDQFFPAIDIQKDGTVHIIFGDRQYDITTPNDNYGISYTVSLNNGLDFTTPQRVSKTLSDPVVSLYLPEGLITGILIFPGDYFDLAVTEFAAHPIWGDRSIASWNEECSYNIASSIGKKKVELVAGILDPQNKLKLMLPYLALGSIIVITAATFMIKKKKI